MGKIQGKSVFTGLYLHNETTRMPPRPRTPQADIRDLTDVLNEYFWTAYSNLNGNYLAVVTVIFFMLLTFMLPDISQKMHRTHELNAMKKALDLVSEEVSRAEVACITVAEKIDYLKNSMHDGATETSKQQQDLGVCTSASMRATRSAPVQAERKFGFFRRFFYPHRNISHKEVTLMSYVYTDSFNGTNKKETAEI